MKKADTDQQLSEQAPGERPRRTPRKPTTAKFYIYFMPEGKSGERVEKGSIPPDVDFVDHIDERTDLESGLYRIEKRKGGEFAEWTGFYTKDDYPESTINLERRSDAEEASFAFESDQSHTPNSLDDARIAKLVASAVNAVLDARDRRERAAQEQPGAIDMLREIEEIAERRAERDRQLRESIRAEVAAMLPQQNSASSAPEQDPETQASVYFMKNTGAIKEMMRGVREVITSPERIDEPQSLSDKILDFAKGFIPYVGPVVGPVVGQRLLSMLNKADDASLMQAAGVQPTQASATAQPQPQGAPPVADSQQPASTAPPTQPNQVSEAERTLEQFTLNVKADLQEDNDPDDAVSDVIKLRTEHPELIPTLEQLLVTPNDQLLAILSQATGAQLTQLTNANEYLDGLKNGVRARLQPVNVEAAVSSNGTRAAATA
jgi:flagellar basal body-associated protein FliL